MMRMIFGLLFVSLFAISCGDDQNTTPDNDDMVADNTVDNVQTDETVDLEISDSDLVIEGPGNIGAMVNVPAGEFMMGCNEAVDSECDSDETPYHSVTLGAYKIGKYEVTVGEYQQCVDAGVCNNNDGNEQHYTPYTDANYFCNLGAANKDKYPMNCVTWYGAKAYCEWASQRLPSEAEWEKAARGTDGRKYPWGNEAVSCDYAVMNDENAGGEGCGTGGTMPVGGKEAGKSPYDAYDMIGNVWEWVNDWYSATYYESSPTENPTGPESGIDHVLRGGSWNYDASTLRASDRGTYDHPGSVYARRYGFRCVE